MTALADTPADPYGAFTARAGFGEVLLEWDIPDVDSDVVGFAITYVFKTNSESYYPDDPSAGNRLLYGGDEVFPLGVSTFTHLKHANGENISNANCFYYSLFPVKEDGETWTKRYVTQACAGDDDPPPPLAAFEATRGDRAALLRWTNPGNSDFYRILIRYQTGSYPAGPEYGKPVENGNYGYFSGEPGGQGSYTHSGLANDTTYYYAAFAVDFSNNIETSGFHDSAKPVDRGPPGEVLDFTIQERERELVLRWVHPPDSDLRGALVLFSAEKIIGDRSDGEPVPFGEGGFFEGRPGRIESFVHSGLVNRKTYNYAIFTVDSLGNWSDGVRRSARPVDLTAPDLALGVLQNPYLTSQLDVIVLANEPLDPATIELRLDTVPIGVEPLDGSGTIWKGDFKIAAPGSTAISIVAADSSGNGSDLAASFASAVVTPDGGGTLRSADGRVAVVIPPGTVRERSFALVMPAGEESAPAKGSGAPQRAKWLNAGGEPPAAWSVSPVGLLRGADAELSADYAGTSLDGAAPDRIVIERVGGAPEALETWVDPGERRASATIDRFGTFALRAGAAGSATPIDPSFIALRGNSPNPFNPSTLIEFEIRSPGRVKVELYDIRGRLVATLLDDRLYAGRHSVRWSGDDRHGRPLPSGIYACRLVTDGGSDSRKLMLMR